MNKRWTTILLVVIIICFAGYIVYDLAFTNHGKQSSPGVTDTLGYEEAWEVEKTFKPSEGPLTAVANAENGNIILGGDSFVSVYDSTMKFLWGTRYKEPITALSASGDTVFAATSSGIISLAEGTGINSEWVFSGDTSIITSIAATKNRIAFADAGSRLVYIIDKKGNLIRIIGASDEKFVIPSPYFDIAFGTNNELFIANTGKLRIETWSPEGELKTTFGEAGLAPDAFCGCCNPAHFIAVPGGFITSEKGINRIKTLDLKGSFIDFVSVNNRFVPSVPLDLASRDGRKIYAANPYDSKLYIFKRKEMR